MVSQKFGAYFLLLVLSVIQEAHAGKRGVFPANTPAIYYSECAECHVAFPPDLLPSNSWKKIMVDLHEHFGSNAQVDDQIRRQIEDYLLSNSGATLGVKKDGSDLRITQTLWFNRMHGKSKRYFDNSCVGSGSNCAVCHSHATDGRFDENKIPANTDWQLQLNPFGLNRKPNTK